MQPSALHKKWSFPSPQETADLVYLLKKSLMENFIFCAMVMFIIHVHL